MFIQDSSVGWTHRVSVAVIIAVLVSACSSQHEPVYATPGALYVEFWGKGSPPNDAPQETVEIRQGRVVAHYPVGYVVARDRPTWSPKAPTSAECDRGYSISPDGTHALCYSESKRTLRLYDVHRRRMQNVVVRNLGDNVNNFAWMDNDRVVATVLDNTCPYATLYEYFPTRLETFDRDGKRLSTGPCAYGVVAGEHRLAIMGEAPNGFLWSLMQVFADDPKYYNDGYDRAHHTWSVDFGKTWHDGMPLTFDGNDMLLYREPFSETVRSENGAVALKNAYSVQWSR